MNIKIGDKVIVKDSTFSNSREYYGGLVIKVDRDPVLLRSVFLVESERGSQWFSTNEIELVT